MSYWTGFLNKRAALCCPECKAKRRSKDRFCQQCGVSYADGGNIKNPVSGCEPIRNVASSSPLRLKTRPCPACNVQISGDALLCVSCGFNLATGQRTSTISKRRRPLGELLQPFVKGLSVVSIFLAKVLFFSGLAVGLCFFGHRLALRLGICEVAGRAGVSGEGRSALLLGAKPQAVLSDVDATTGGHGAGAEQADNYAAGYQEYLQRFTPPASNTVVKLSLSNGSEMTGRLVEVSGSSVVIENNGMVVGCSRNAMMSASRVRFFADDFAAYHAKHALDGNREKELASEPSAAGGVATSASTSMRIDCQCCGGEGYYVMRRKLPASDVRETCPVCRRRAFKILECPNGKVLCPDCKGWGVTWYAGVPALVRENGNLHTVTSAAFDDLRKTRACSRCGTRGYIASAAAPPPSAFTTPPAATTPSVAPSRSVASPPSEISPIWKALIGVVDEGWHMLVRHVSAIRTGR